MKKFLAARLAEMKKWWSLWAGFLTAATLATVPVVADRWPDLAPAFVALFPQNGQQWAPVVGVGLTIVAPIVSQAAVLDAFRKLFKGKDDAAQ
jgi:hypothetical protein